MAELRAGVGRIDITPPMGVELCGYGPYRNRRATGIGDRLEAKAVAIESGGETFVLISCDLVGVTSEMTVKTRRMVSENSSVPYDNIMIATTHTHSGPNTISLGDSWGASDQHYTESLPARFASAAKIALGEMLPVTMLHGAGELHGLAGNRIDGDGPVDRTMDILRFNRDDGSPLVIIAHATAHPVTNRDTNTLVSRDFPGVMCDILESAFPGVLPIFLQGSCGDVNPILVHTGKRREAGQIAGGRALMLAALAEVVEVDAVAVTAHTADLPLVALTADEIDRRESAGPQEMIKHGNPDKWKRFYSDWAAVMRDKLKAGTLSDSMAAEIQIARIGPIVFAAHPTELFSTFSLELREIGGDRIIIPVGYANDMIGYIPDAAAFESRAYEADLVPRMFQVPTFRSDVGTVLVQEMKSAVLSLS